MSFFNSFNFNIISNKMNFFIVIVIYKLKNRFLKFLKFVSIAYIMVILEVILLKLHSFFYCFSDFFTGLALVKK